MKRDLVHSRFRVARWPAAGVVGLLLSLSLGVVVLSGCEAPGGRAADAEVWRFAIEETQGSVQDVYARRFAERIERETDGAVEVIVYPYGALGTSDQITEQVHNGTLELAMASPGHLGKLIPALQVFLLHYVLPTDPAESRAVLQDPKVRGILDELYREHGLRFLSAFGEGAQVWTTRKPIRRPSDFRGVKLRVMTSPLLMAAYEAYGASPTPLPYSEIYGALQLEMIDGQVNPVFAIEEMSFYEVTSHLVFAGQAQFFATVTANPGFVDGLSSGRRELLLDTIRALHEEIDQVQQTFNRERLDEMLAKKPELEVVRLTDEQRARFREASRPVRERFLEMTGPRGKALLDALVAARPDPSGERSDP